MAAPPKLTYAGYVAFLESIPTHPSWLYFASSRGDVEAVRQMLRDNPDLDVNWRRANGTALCTASFNDHDGVVSMLLAHPDIDVNLGDYNGRPPLVHTCLEYQSTGCAWLLLKDSRVKTNNFGGNRALREAAYCDHANIIRWWIAYGRKMDLGKEGDWSTDVLKAAKKQGATLLKDFQTNRKKTKGKIRQDLGETGMENFENQHKP